MPPALYSRAQLDARKRETDLVAVVREQGIALTRRGRTYFGRCPILSLLIAKKGSASKMPCHTVKASASIQFKRTSPNFIHSQKAS